MMKIHNTFATLGLLLALTAQAGPADRLAEAVRFRTISSQDPAQVDREQFRKFNDYLRRTYPRVFSELQVDVVSDFSLMLTWPGSQGDAGAILFTAHSDVVPVEPGTEGDWEHPAFAGVIEDDIVYGRGTLDDKVGVISLLEAVGSLLADDFRPRRTIVLAFGHDEEVGGRQGAAQLAELMRRRGLEFDWMVDEGGLIVSGHPMLPRRPLGIINVAEKGYLTLVLEATGEGGHSSQPPKESTIGRLSRAMTRIENNPFPTQLVPPVDAMLEALAPYSEQPQRTLLANLWLTAPLVANQMGEDRLSNSFVRTTTALTMFNAGIKENVVPQRAEARVNFRLLPGHTPEQVINRIREVVDDPLVTIRHEQWNNVPPVSDHRAEGFAVIAAAIAEVYPEAVVAPSLLTATTDTRHYIGLAKNQYRFHGMKMPTTDASSIHGTNERISVESFENTVRIAELMMRKGGS